MGINSEKMTRSSSQAEDREGDETREWFSRYHNKRRQINAFGLESNQHYSDNSPPANTHLTLLGLILSTARTTSPPFPLVRQSSLNVFLYPRCLLRAVAPPTNTSLALLIPRADDKYANKRTTGMDIRRGSGDALKPN